MLSGPQVEEIARDNTSGAQRLTEKLVSLITEIFAAKKLTQRGSQKILLELARRMLGAQPAMAPMFNLFSELLYRLERLRDESLIARAVPQAAQDFARAMSEHSNAISVHLFGLVHEKDVILTHSASQAVREGLRLCWTKGRRFSVICSESRPVYEGRSLARDFAQMGIPTCLIPDALAFALLKGETEFHGKVRLMLVGADSVSAHGITNKAGTVGLALAAREWSIPFYVLAGSEKFLPASYPVGKAIQQKPPEEILSAPPQGLTIINRYFDITPLKFVAAVIAEQGALSRRRLVARLNQLQMHPRLARLIEKEL